MFDKKKREKFLATPWGSALMILLPLVLVMVVIAVITITVNAINYNKFLGKWEHTSREGWVLSIDKDGECRMVDNSTNDITCRWERKGDEINVKYKYRNSKEYSFDGFIDNEDQLHLGSVKYKRLK